MFGLAHIYTLDSKSYMQRRHRTALYLRGGDRGHNNNAHAVAVGTHLDAGEAKEHAEIGDGNGHLQLGWRPGTWPGAWHAAAPPGPCHGATGSTAAWPATATADISRA